MKCVVIVIILFFQTTVSFSQQAIELGTVSWIRNYDEALHLAKESGKDILVLFQEVPGCATCQKYGNAVLRHPLLVEALESEFIPLAIYNNHGGEDKRILDKYEEPSWNNPVLRMIDAKGANILDRLSGDYSSLGLVNYIIQGLRKRSKPVPEYLALMQQSLDGKAQRLETDYFQMYCFWSGEAAFGQLDGVVATTPGFMNGAEVVEVVYADELITKDQLTKQATANNCTYVSKRGHFRKDKDPQYYLKKSSYKYLPLTNIQRTRINSVLQTRDDPRKYLSPKQLAYLDIISKKRPTRPMYDLPFEEAWQYMLEAL